MTVKLNLVVCDIILVKESIVKVEKLVFGVPKPLNLEIESEEKELLLAEITLVRSIMELETAGCL